MRRRFAVLALLCVALLAVAFPEAPAVTGPTAAREAARAEYSSWWGYGDIRAWRVTGLEPGDPDPSFHYPLGIAVADAGDVYVADSMNDAILHFTSDGAYVGTWGATGQGPGEFNKPSGLAVADTGQVFVADSMNNRIQVFDANGAYLDHWGTVGHNNGEFSRPTGLAFNDSGKLLVADTFNDRVQKFSMDGTYLTQFGEPGDRGGQFNKPVGVAVGPNGRIYVTDNGNRRVEIFAADGTFIEMWDWGFNAPAGITADDYGNVYIANAYEDEIVVMDYLGWGSAWGSTGTELGSFDTPSGIATDAAGNVYVSDTYNKRIQVLPTCCDIYLHGPWHAVDRGRTIKLKAWLLSNIPDCVAGSTIRFFKRDQEIGSAVTNGRGLASFEVRARRRTWYKAVFDGRPHPNGTCPPAESWHEWIWVKR